ncbi:MAG TPA: BrxA/BrxB family bacilliredoxin [Flavobacteriaceae bacterium]|jgi:putative YphP/YqiW family bacilliredoxin|nr:BrxA/BrxB family bacilliredoxin [Flavobacteriaceae bacterium]HBS12260.1 BrxA/BrxB family bacilliredoxin [Flavobacteriaceae bacterium]
MYPEEIVKPMRQELVSAGFTELKTADDVDNILKEGGTTLIMLNSVCGCAAGTARPGAIASLQFDKTPTHVTTVFAGVDVDAVAKAREHMIPFPPSSPAVALFKDGELVHMLERHHIEGRSAEMIASNLTAAYDEFC